MSAGLAAPVRTPLRERLAYLLNATAEGVWRGDDCGNCAGVFADPADRCPECAQAAEDGERLDAGITAVQDAPTEAAALGAWFDCLAGVAGMGILIETAAVRCGHGAGAGR